MPAARTRDPDTRRAGVPRPGRHRAPRPVRRLAAAGARGVDHVRDVWAAFVANDRPYLVALAVLLFTSTVMLSGPLQNYLDGRGRVDHLEEQLAVLQTENDRLDARRSDLQDPDTVELLAREQLGLVRPGEVAYAVVPPDVDRPQIAPPRDPDPGDEPWYRSVWQAVSGLFR